MRRITITAWPPETGFDSVVEDKLAGTYSIEGNFTYDVEDLESIIRVQLDNSVSFARPAGWAYRDPSNQLGVGDRVVVPFGLGDTLHRGTVVGLGRSDGFEGPVKDAFSQLIEVEQLVEVELLLAPEGSW
jgi:hypothetical protein